MRSVKRDFSVARSLRAGGFILFILLAGLLGSTSAMAQVQLDRYFCAGDIKNVGNCTANEVSLSGVTGIEVTDLNGDRLTECFDGQLVKVSNLNAELDNNTGQRWDITFWVGRFGNDPRDASGLPLGDPDACATTTLPEDGTGAPYISDNDGDFCWDFAIPPTPVPLTFGGSDATFECRDSDGNGIADLQVLTTWDQQESVVGNPNKGFFCGAGNQTYPYDLNDPVYEPGAPSKCDITTLETVPIVENGNLTIRKQSVDGTAIFPFNVTGGQGVDESGDLDTSISNPIDWVLELQAGETYDIAEAIPTGWALADASCNDGQGTADLAAGTLTGITVGSGDDIICTFINTRLAAQITLQKEWVDGAVDDTAALDVTGPSGTATATSTSIGGDVVDNVNTAVLVELTGETVVLSEVLGGIGDYTTSFSCDGVNTPTYTPGDRTASLLIDFADVAVTCTYTNTLNTSQLTLQKAWVGGVAADTAELTAAGINGPSVATSIASGGDETDTTNVAVLTALVGENVTLSEVLGGTGSYTASFSCDGVNAPTYTPGDTSATLLIDGADADITCTYTNTINTAQVTLQKAWVGGVAGDTAALDATGANGSSTATSTSNGGDETDTSNVAVLTALVGETISLSEVLGGVGDYSSGLTCVGAANQPTPLNDTSATLLIDAADTAITCTYTNTINTAQVTLQKAWIGGVTDDTSLLDVSGLLGNPTATSTATGGDQTDTTNTAVLTSLVGETVTFSETLGGTGLYNASFSCLGATNAPVYTPGETTATLVIDAADSAITCTFTNSIQVSGITLQKSWVGAVAGDTAGLNIAATNGTATATSTAAGGDEVDLDNTAFLATALVGETVTLSETLGGVGSYSTGFVCTGSTNAPVYTPGETSATLLIDEGDTSITCTFTNSVNTADVTLQKAWVDGVANDTASLDITGLDGSAQAVSVATGGDQTDTINTAVFTALVGDTITLSEVLGGVGDYTSGFSCSSVNAPVYTPGETSATLLIDATDTAITCTYTNTLNTSQLTLQKTWVGGVAADTAGLTVTGINGSSIATSTANGGDETDTTNVAVLTALVGETVTLSEVLGGVGEYTVSFSCDGVNAPTYTPGETSATLQIDGADADITCTYTNTVNAVAVTLQKAWVDDVADDTAALTAAGTLGTEQATSTASGGSETDTTNTAVLNTLVGETITLSEVLGDTTTDYTVSFSCDGVNTPTYLEGATSATLVIDATDTAITCTYTNTRDLPVINLAKVVDGTATLEDGSGDYPAGTYTVLYTITASNTGGYGEYDVVDTFSPGDGITLNTAVAAYQAGSEDDQSGVTGDYPDFVTTEGLAADLDESWVVTANFTVDPASVVPDTRVCAPEDAVNTGFYNLVTGSDTDTDLSDNDACTDLPEESINLAKTSTPAVNVEADIWEVVYTITATNTGEGPGVYDIVDTLMPGDGITPVIDSSYPAIAYVGGEVQSGVITTPPLANGGTWVTLESLVAQASETWTVTARFTVDEQALIESPTNADCTLDDGEQGTGYFNYVEGSETDEDLSDNETCVPHVIALPPPTAVPTLSAWAMLLLVLLMTGVTGWYFRSIHTRRIS